MTLQDAADIAQVISAVAVVVSLIYVGIEIRHNSRELQLATQQNQADAATGYLIPLALDPMFGELTARSMTGKLTPVDNVRVTLMMNGVFTQFQAGFDAAQLNRRSLSSWWGYQQKAMASWLVDPTVQAWWNKDRALFSPAFAAVVDAKLAAIQAAQAAGEAPPL